MQPETVCPECFGRGRKSVTVEQVLLHIDLGTVPTGKICWRCNGTGRVPDQKEEDPDVRHPPHA